MEGLVGPHEGGAAWREIGEGADAATTHSMEDAAVAADGPPVEDGGEDA